MTKVTEPESVAKTTAPLKKPSVKKPTEQPAAEKVTVDAADKPKKTVLVKKKKPAEAVVPDVVTEPEITEITAEPVIEEPIDDIWSKPADAVDAPQEPVATAPWRKPHRNGNGVPSIVVKSPTAPLVIEEEPVVPQSRVVVEELETDEDETESEEEPIAEVVATPQQPIEQPPAQTAPVVETDAADQPKPLKSALKKPKKSAAAEDNDPWSKRDDELPAPFQFGDKPVTSVPAVEVLKRGVTTHTHTHTENDI